MGAGIAVGATGEPTPAPGWPVDGVRRAGRLLPGTKAAPRVTAHSSEDNLHVACQNRIKHVHCGWVIKVHGGAHQAKAQPDLIGCLRGRMLAIELKQPGNVPTPLQSKRLLEWHAANALAGWVTTEAELDELLTHAGDLEWVNPQIALLAA